MPRLWVSLDRIIMVRGGQNGVILFVKTCVFSAAGKMHGDLQKSAKDSTLEHSLFAAFNTD